MCHLKYTIEPSLYPGAMYVSYGVGVAIAIATYRLTHILDLNFGPKGVLITIIVTLSFLMPYIAAISKSIWAHFFFKYNPEIAKKSDDRRAQKILWCTV